MNYYLYENNNLLSDLIKKLKGKKVDFPYIINMNKDLWLELNIDQLYNNNKFNDLINKHDLKKDILQNIEYNETFFNDVVDLKFFTIYKNNPLNPKYIVLQMKKDNNINWSDMLVYEIENINDFVYALTSKTIEIINGSEKYIYETTDGGNDWILKNSNIANDKFKKNLSNKEIGELISNDDVKVEIVSNI